jgi:hypothetical protein
VDKLKKFMFIDLKKSLSMNGTGFEEHLKGAAELAASFAEEFGCGE